MDVLRLSRPSATPGAYVRTLPCVAACGGKSLGDLTSESEPSTAGQPTVVAYTAPVLYSVDRSHTRPMVLLSKPRTGVMREVTALKQRTVSSGR